MCVGRLKHKPFLRMSAFFSQKCQSSGIANYTVVSRKYAPSFVTSALVRSTRGGAYMQYAMFSLAITPSHTLAINRKWLAVLWMLPSFCALPFHHGDLEPDCVGISMRSRHLCEDSKGWGSRALPQSSWRVHHCCGWSAFAVDSLTVEGRGLISIFQLRDESSSGGGRGMRGIKIPLQDFAPKMQGGLMHEGGGGGGRRICRTPRYMHMQ